MSFDDLYNAARSAANWIPGYNKYQIDASDYLSGWASYRSKVASQNTQISYDEYMRRGNERALEDWNRLYGSKGLTIRYPELSYPGAITGYNAGISRAYISNDIAGSDMVGSLPYRGAGLYGIAGRAFRTL